MSNTISFDAYDDYLAKKKGANRVDTTRDYDLSTAAENIVKGFIPGNTTSFVKGIEKATGSDLSGLRKAAAVMDFVPSKLDAGFLGAAEGITDFLAGGATQLVGQKEAAKWIYDHSWSRELSGTDAVDEELGGSKGYQVASDIISGIGNVGFQVAIGYLIGGALSAPLASGQIGAGAARAIQYAPLFMSASGSGTAESMQKTGELGWRENVSGLLKGAVEIATEIASPTGRIAEGALFGKNAKGMSRYLVKNAIAKNMFTSFAGEAGEEALSYVGDLYIEKWLGISDEKFSWSDMGYQAVLGGITGALFAAPTDASFIRQARKAGADVYAKGDSAVKAKIDEGLIEIAALKERGFKDNENVKLAEAALARLATDESLNQKTKEYYLGLAEQMVMRAELNEQYTALAKQLVEDCKADPKQAQTIADAMNAIVNEAGGEGKYTVADFTNENSDAARLYVVAQMANNWLSRSDAETAIDDIMKRKAALYQGTEEQKTAIRSMQDGSTVAFRVGNNAYAVVTKRAGTDTYSVGFTTPGQVESDGAVYATHKLSLKQVEEMLTKPMTEQQIDAGIVENLAKKAQAEVKKEQKAEKKQAKTETKKKPAAKTTATETSEAEGKAKPEQTAKKTEVKTETTTEAEQAESEVQKREREREERRKKREEQEKRNAERLAALKKKKHHGLSDELYNKVVERWEKTFGKGERHYNYTIAKKTGYVTVELPGVFQGMTQKEKFGTIDQAIEHYESFIANRYHYNDSESIKGLNVNQDVENYKLSKEYFVEHPDIYNGIQMVKDDLMLKPYKELVENLKREKETLTKRKAKTDESGKTTPAERRRLNNALRHYANFVFKENGRYKLSVAVASDGRDGKHYLIEGKTAIVMNEDSDFLYPSNVDSVGVKEKYKSVDRETVLPFMRVYSSNDEYVQKLQKIIDDVHADKAKLRVNAQDVLKEVNAKKDSELGVVKIGGIYYNSKLVKLVANAIENPVLYHGEYGGKKMMLVVEGDNGYGTVLPMRVTDDEKSVSTDFSDGSTTISYSPAAENITADSEQTTQQAQTEAKKVAPEDLTTVEKRLTSAFGIDGSEFTKEEWTKARECVPNIDGLTRREQARVLTLVRTAQANGINEDYMKGLARLSSVYGFGVVFEDIDVAGFYSRKNGMVVINPNNLDETYGHEIKHTFDQVIKEGNAEFREDLSAKVKKIVGASVFEKARSQYKADYEKLRARDGSVAEMSDAELDAEASANVVGKYLSNMTLLKKLAATDYKLGRGLLAAIRRMKDKWTSAKAFAKENDSTAFAEYRKMTRIENLLMKELGWNKQYGTGKDGVAVDRNGNVSFNVATYNEKKIRVGKDKEGEPIYKSGREILEEQFRRNGHTEEDIKASLDQLDKVSETMKKLGKNYQYLRDWNDKGLQYNVETGSLVFSALVKNGEYEINFDFTTVCKHREAFTKVLEELVRLNKAEEVVLTAQRIVEINTILTKHKLQTACTMCFVESRRNNIRKWSISFKDKWNKIVREIYGKQAKYGNFSANAPDTDGVGVDLDSVSDMMKQDISTDEDISEILAEREEAEDDPETAAKNTEGKIRRLVKSNPQYAFLLRESDLYGTVGVSKIKAEFPDMYSILLQSYGVATPKITLPAAPYANELDMLKKGKKSVYKGGTYKTLTVNGKKVNFTLGEYSKRIGGVRLQSFSDYQMLRFLDYCQLIADAQANGCAIQCYTKEIDMVHLFGLTGMKINMSLVPTVHKSTMTDALGKEYAGLIANPDGTFDYAIANESIPWQETYTEKGVTRHGAFWYQNQEGYKQNVGTILIGVSKYQILKALADPNIRMIIPYHASGMAKGLQMAYHIDGFEDYTSLQHTRKFNGEKWVNVSKKEEFDFYEAYLRLNGDAKQACFEYLQYCDEHGYRPKFFDESPNTEGFVYINNAPEGYKYSFTDKDGNRISMNENYYKMIEDFSCYDGDGNVIQQGTVKLALPEDWGDIVVRGLKEAGEQDKLLKQEMQPILEEVQAAAKNAITKKEKSYQELGEAYYAEKQKQVVPGVTKDVAHSPAPVSAETNAEYMRLAEDPQKNESKLRKMVKEAAEKAGFNSPLLYHGTRKAVFTAFDTNFIFATTSKYTASAYAGKDDTLLSPKKLEEWNLGKAPMSEIASYWERNGKPIRKATFQDVSDLAKQFGSKGLWSYHTALFRNGLEAANAETAYEKTILAYAKKIYKIGEKFDNGITEEDARQLVKYYDEMQNVIENEPVFKESLRLSKFRADIQALSYSQVADYVRKVISNDGYVVGNTIYTEQELRRETSNDIRWKLDQDGKIRQGMYQLYGKMQNPLVLDAHGEGYRGFWSKVNGEEMQFSTDSAAKYAKEHGYDSCIIKDVYDTGRDDMYETSDVYVFFDSADVKSADPVTYDDSGNVIPLSERFNPQNNDIRYSPAEQQRRVVTRAQMPRPGITERITNARGQLNRRGLKNALDSASSAWESFKIVTVNAQQALENQLIRGGMTKRQAAAWSQLARTGRLHANNAIGYALADMTGEVRSDGLMKIITPFLAQKGEVYKAWDEDQQKFVDVTAKGGELAGKRYDDFSDYLAMLNAIDRAKVGKNPYSDMTVGQMQKIVAEYEKANPDFKAASEQFSQYNNVMLDILVQSGMVSQELADKFRKMYPHYIPMRTADSTPVGSGAIRGSENLEVKRGLRTAEESNHRVDDPIKNYITQVESRIKAAKLNMLAIEIYETADGVNVVRGQDSRATAKELRAMEKQFLEDPLSMPDPTELFRKFQTGDNTRNEITFYKDGKMLTMAVSDRIYTGFTDLAGQHSAILDSNLAKLSKKINDTFKKLVTNWNPFFAVRNIARDLQDGLLQTQYGFFEFQQMYLKNAQMMASGKFNDLWVEFVANGGLESSLFSDEFATYTIGGKSGLEQAHGVVGQFQHIKNFNTLTEALPRFTEYCLTRKHGGSVQTALLNAADVTVNFGRGGTLTKILNSTVSPFLNPAVQGLDRVVRLFTENGLRNNKALASLLLKAFLLGILPMVLSNAMYGGDKEYEDMKDNVKENNYLFKIGNTWLKIPRGRVVSTISGLYNRSSKQVTGQYVDWADYGKNVLDQITPAQNVARHIASPFVDVANNKTWYGSAIESQSLQNYAVKDRYDENTSRIAVWIGQFTSHFGYSPKKVHYLLDQYSGVVGDILLPATTPAGTRGVVAYNFTVDANTSSNLSERFYKVYNEAMYAANAGDEEAYYLKKRLDETKSAVAELFKEIKTINADSSLSNKEKVQQASAIRAMINQLYKTAVQDAKGYAANVKDALAINGSYEVVQITQKNAKQYGLTSSDVGKYAVTFGGQSVKLYGSESEANGFMTDSSKKTIYAEANRLTYGSEYALKEYNTNVYEKAKTLNELGISYDEYYNYYMTVRYYSGKDKKQKILAYLNGSGMSKSQTALMMYFSGYSAYKEDAKKAINASNLSAERKKELLAQYVD